MLALYAQSLHPQADQPIMVRELNPSMPCGDEFRNSTRIQRAKRRAVLWRTVLLGLLLSAVNSPIWGPEVQISCDLGQSCHGSAEGPKFNGDSGSAVRRVWNIAAGSAETFREVDSLSNHPTRVT